MGKLTIKGHVQQQTVRLPEGQIDGKHGQMPWIRWMVKAFSSRKQMRQCFEPVPMNCTIDRQICQVLSCLKKDEEQSNQSWNLILATATTALCYLYQGTNVQEVGSRTTSQDMVQDQAKQLKHSHENLRGNRFAWLPLLGLQGYEIHVNTLTIRLEADSQI